MLLTAAAERIPDEARSVFRRYLRGARPNRCRTVCEVLDDLDLPWDAELLGPLLDDTREVRAAGKPEPDKKPPAVPLRVCDEAAKTLSGRRSGISFTLSDSRADRDKQIAAIKEQLKRKK